MWCSAGESEETFLADIAVGVGADAILTGAPRGAEHCSKLNQVRGRWMGEDAFVCCNPFC